MSIYIPETNEIYFAKTKEYFKEVISSYSNGNYRSATVMLYSVAICDILFKLQELKDMYNDSTAIAILKKVEKEQKESSSKSSWEKTLLDEIKEKTQLLDLKALSDLNHLFEDRNLSAHPAMNGNYELISPTQETTIAHINNVLNQILIKPPIFIKNVIGMLTDDLKEKSDIYENNREDLAIYLNNKYYQHMNNSMKLKVFKAFWKFCFIETEDENCKTFRRINRIALNILVEPIEANIKKEIEDNINNYVVANDVECLLQLIAFLSLEPSLYHMLGKDVKLSIDKLIELDGNAKWGAWFKFKNLNEHLAFLKSSILNIELSHLRYVYKHYCSHGKKEEIISYYIDLFSFSCNYDMADRRYACCIKPFIKDFNKTAIEKLVRVINENNQIYDRWASTSANTEIVKTKKEIFLDNFDFSQYPNFKFDESVLKEDDKNGD